MENPQKRPQQNVSRYLLILGTGLILTGLAFFILLQQPAPDASAATDSPLRPAEVNYPAPELTLNDIQGHAASLSELRGQVVLVNLWATWCPPCKKEMPTLQAYYEKHKEQGFVIVAINDGDPQADVIRFAREYGLTFPVWLDPQYIATEQAFKAPNLPSSYIIDRTGIIRLRWVGEIAERALEGYVTPIITE
jgi:peroxiredoxin